MPRDTKGLVVQVLSPASGLRLTRIPHPALFSDCITAHSFTIAFQVRHIRLRLRLKAIGTFVDEVIKAAANYGQQERSASARTKVVRG